MKFFNQMLTGRPRITADCTTVKLPNIYIFKYMHAINPVKDIYLKCVKIYHDFFGRQKNDIHWFLTPSSIGRVLSVSHQYYLFFYI